MYHVYDPSTKELKAVSNGSPALVATWEGLGLTVAQAGRVPLEDFNYLGDELTPKIAVTLTPDKEVIDTDDTDAAVVVVQAGGEPPAASIDIEVDGVSATVSLTAGVGTLPPITSPVEHVFEVRVSDQITYKDSGGCQVAAQAQE